MFKTAELTSKAGLFFPCSGSWTNQDLYAWGIHVYNNKNHKPVYNFESDGFEIADLLHLEVGKLRSNLT